jgi:Delta7-sterol 5-desaturase
MYIEEFISGLTVDVVRYFVFAGIPFLLLYVIFKSKVFRYKIQQKFPENKHIVREIGFSLLSMFIFSFFSIAVFILQQKGYTKIYTDIGEHSIAYLIFSVFSFIVAHDTYFYWSHRLMHHKKIYPHVHLIHHKSFNPTPWATKL